MNIAQLDTALPAYTPERLGLSTVATVDRRLARKRTSEDVLINDVVRRDGLLAAAGTLPRSHRYFNDLAWDRCDALHLAAFLVQGVEVMSGALLGVPPENHFVLRTVRLRVSDPAAAAVADHAVVVLAERQVRRNASGAVYAVAGPIHVLVDGRPIAHCGGLLGFLTPETYDAMRDEQGRTGLDAPAGRVLPARPETVGRRQPDNVVIGWIDGALRETRGLLVPAAHPTFFDRPLDHYPGMMIAEAARQLAVRSLAESAGVPADWVRTASASLQFASFAELDAPPALRIVSFDQDGPGAEIAVEARQGQRITSTCIFQMSAQQPNGSLP